MIDTQGHILDEHDIAELDELLSSLLNEDALRLDAAQGLLAALSVGPKDVAAQKWMPVILGEKPMVEDPDAAERLIELLVRLKRAVDYGIEHYAFDAIFSEVIDEAGEHRPIERPAPRRLAPTFELQRRTACLVTLQYSLPRPGFSMCAKLPETAFR